jgi:hypothetical protein
MHLTLHLMFKHLSTTGAIVALASGFAIAPAAFGQAVQKNTDTSNILVAIDGISCNAAGPTGFPALSFHIGVSTSSSGGGGGGDKAFFSALTLTRMFDSSVGVCCISRPPRNT